MNNIINKKILSRNFISFSHNDSDDNYYINYSGKDFKSDLFGRKIPKFKSNFSGFANYEKRLLNNSIEPISFKIDENFYFPKNKFDYFQFPRKKMKNNFFINFQEKLNKTFSNDYYKKLVNSNEKKFYFTKICFEEKLKKKDDEKIINSIDFEIKNFNLQIKNNKKTNFSFAQIQTLKNFKKKILNYNNNINLIQPSKKIKEKFKIIKNSILNKNFSQKKIDFKINNFKNDFSNKIKTKKFIINQSLNEQKFLKGFFKPEKKIKGIFQRFNFILNNNKKIYENDLNLIKIVNPIHIKNEENYFLKDKKFFMKNKNLLNKFKK